MANIKLEKEADRAYKRITKDYPITRGHFIKMFKAGVKFKEKELLPNNRIPK